MSQHKIPQPEDTVLLDPRARFKSALKRFLMIPTVHGIIGQWLTTRLIQKLNLSEA